MEQTDKRAAEWYVSEMDRDGLWTPADAIFVKKLSDRAAKAERGSKTLKDHMKKQHMLSEIAENSNPV